MKDTDSMYRAMQLGFFKVETLLNNVFKQLGTIISPNFSPVMISNNYAMFTPSRKLSRKSDGVIFSQNGVRRGYLVAVTGSTWQLRVYVAVTGSTWQ